MRSQASVGGVAAAAQTDANNLHKKQSCKCEWNSVTSYVRWAPANYHPHVHRLRKAANKGDPTTSGRIIPTIDFCCWVLQKETVGLSGQDPSALSLTKRVFSGLIRQKAYYQWSQPPPQLDKEKGCPPICHRCTDSVARLHKGPWNILKSQNNLCMLTTNSPQGCFILYIFVYLASGVDVWPPQLSALCFTICQCLSGSMKLLLRPCMRTLTRDNAKSYNPREEPNAGLDHRENYVYFNYRQRSRQILVKHLSPDPRWVRLFLSVKPEEGPALGMCLSIVSGTN